MAGREAGPPPTVDLAAERRTGDFVRVRITAGSVSACHDVSDGGLLTALAEMALAGRTGLILDRPETILPPHAWWFGEEGARYVLATTDPDALLAAAGDAGIPATVLGQTGGTDLTLPDGVTISLDQLRAEHDAFFPAMMGS